MKILILGGTGLVGNYIKNELEKTHDVIATSRLGIDPLISFDFNKDETYGILSDSYDFVIDCTVDYSLGLNDKLKNDVLGREKLLRLLLPNKTHYIAISSISATPENKNLSDYNFSKFLSDETIYHFSKLHQLQYTILRFGQIFDYEEKAKKIQGALYYFISSFRSNQTLNIFGNTTRKRTYIPIEILVKTVKKTIDEKITGTHDVIMPDSYSSEDLVAIFSQIVPYSLSNLKYHPEKSISEYTIPKCSPVFHNYLMKETCLAYFRKILLKNTPAGQES
jgi:nucleoside-diphosphate-sugar epimerase